MAQLCMKSGGDSDHNLKFFTHCFYAEKDSRRPRVLQILQETHRKPIKRQKLWGTGSLTVSCGVREQKTFGWAGKDRLPQVLRWYDQKLTAGMSS